MSRSTHPDNIKINTVIIGAILAVMIGSVSYVAANHPFATPTTRTVRAVQPTTSLTYSGQDGKTALELLKHRASVQTKKSSLGEYVVSINGSSGAGKKYWIFYVNGKEAQVGAGAYTTHDSDTIQWRLQ